MKKYNEKEIERLFSELEKYGFVFPSCVRWHIDDLKAQAEYAGVNLDGKTDEELAEMLRDILSNNSDWICEEINNTFFYGVKSEE
jgi:DUF438 domain-containing protein